MIGNIRLVLMLNIFQISLQCLPTHTNRNGEEREGNTHYLSQQGPNI